VSRYLIGNLTSNYWVLNPELGWLSPDDVAGDAMRDLRIRNNALSVYEIEDRDSGAYIKRVAAAIGAAFKDKPVDITYRLFDPPK